MQFTTFAISALSISSAVAQSLKVHVVQVGGAGLTFSPNNIKADVGDMIQFQFSPDNHTVTQSTFDAPCQPIAAHSNVTGVYSGFMPVMATSAMTPTWTIRVNNTTPMWLYCSQGKHCQSGMTMVINENSSSNKTLAAYQAAAKDAPVNLPAGSVADGTAGQISNNTSNVGGSGSSSGTGTSGSGSGSGSGTSPSSSPSPSTSAISASGAGMVRAQEALGMGAALFVAAWLLL